MADAARWRRCWKLGLQRQRCQPPSKKDPERRRPPRPVPKAGLTFTAAFIPRAVQIKAMVHAGEFAPGNALGLYYLYSQQGKADEAIKALAEATEAHPGFLPRLGVLGLAYGRNEVRPSPAPNRRARPARSLALAIARPTERRLCLFELRHRLFAPPLVIVAARCPHLSHRLRKQGQSLVEALGLLPLRRAHT